MFSIPRRCCRVLFFLPLRVTMLLFLGAFFPHPLIHFAQDSQAKTSDSRKRSNSTAPVLRSGSSGAMSIDVTSSNKSDQAAIILILGMRHLRLAYSLRTMDHRY